MRVLHAMFREMASDVPVPVALHLDHCPDRQLISDCLAQGWDSVLFDGSRLSVEDNLLVASEWRGGGGGAMLAMTILLFPQFQAAYSDLGIRAQVAQALAALHVIERDIEAGWASSRLLPRQTGHAALSVQPGAALIDEVNVNPVTGRVRVALGSIVPELAGKTILLAPRRDDEDRVQWVCVPVDIPPQYLPRECRG